MIKPTQTAIFVAGPNGSGKSTLIDALSSTELFNRFNHINPDIIVREHKFEETLEGYKQAFAIAEERFEQSIAKSENILRETVLSSSRKLKDIQRLKAAGYEIYMLFISTVDYNVNVLNVVSRVEKGGHDVPIRKLIDRYFKSMENIKKIAPELDCVIFIDNSEISEDPLICSALSHGSVCYEVNQAEWVSEITSTLPRTEVDQEKVQLCHLIQNHVEENFLELTEAPTSYIDFSKV